MSSAMKEGGFQRRTEGKQRKTSYIRRKKHEWRSGRKDFSWNQESLNFTLSLTKPEMIKKVERQRTRS